MSGSGSHAPRSQHGFDGLGPTRVRALGPAQIEPEAHGQEADRDERSDGSAQVNRGEHDVHAARVWRARGRALAALLAFALGWCVPRLVEAAAPLSYDVDAAIDGSREVLTLEVTTRVHVADGETELRFWLMGDRLAVAPALDERSARWIYPGEVSLGGVEDPQVDVDGAMAVWRSEPLSSGREAGGSDLVVTIAAGLARDVTVQIRMRLRVPDRFGRMGRVRGELALLSPWYPVLVGSDAAGQSAWAFEVPHHVEVTAASGEVLLAGDGAAAHRPGHVELEVRAPFVSLFAADHVHERTFDVGATTVRMLGAREEHRPPAEDAEGIEGVEDFVAIDRVALVREVIAEALSTARWLGLEVPSELVLVTVRSRIELAGHAPGVVLISDRLFEVFPLDVVREFHRGALRRAVFAELADALAAPIERPSDRGWATDLRSVVLLELDALHRTREARRPEELLSLFAFHPAVDSLLYAPQITFEQVYFGSIDETDPFRDDPARARTIVSGGRRLLECARDVLDDEAFGRFIAMLAHVRRDVRSAVDAVGASTLLPAWLAYATTRVNYRLGEITSRPNGDGYAHRIEIFRDGDAREEPVEIEVQDQAGHSVVVVWDGRGSRGVVEAETSAPRGTVTIDPRHRLTQSAEIADGHPRADDATDQPFRPPILSAFSLSLLLSEANVIGLVDFAIRRRYDLEHTVSFRLSRSVARTGGRLRYVQGLGPKVHTNRRIGAFGGGIGVNYVEPGFGGSALGGWALDLEVSGSVDSRSYVYDPRNGYSLAGTLILTGTVREDGSLNLGARGAIRAGTIVPVGLLNAFAFVVGGGFTAGPALNADLQSLGGGSGLRGFANDELLGTGAVYGVMEHRITAIPDLAVNVLHLAWLREVQLAWWVGAGGVFETTDGRDAVFALEAGGGVRFHYEYGGIQPGLVSLDVGVPISRFWDPATNTRPPVGFYLAFDQYY
jgi:hypothetical protein